MNQSEIERFADEMLEQMRKDGEDLARAVLATNRVPLRGSEAAAMELGVQAGINAAMTWLKTRGMLA